MAKTVFNQWEKPLSREQFLELFIAQKLDEIDAALGNDFIAGLQLSRASDTSITIGTGAAWVSGYGRLRVSSPITLTGIGLGANAWGHIYLYSNAGVPAVEVVTTAPASYFGTAYQKTGDATHRYLGSVRTGASGSIFKFLMTGNNRIDYLENITATPFRVANGLSNTAETSVSCSAVVPVTGRMAVAHFKNTAASGVVLTGLGASDNFTLSAASLLYGIEPTHRPIIQHPLDSSQAFTFMYHAVPTGGAFFCDLAGYFFDR
jgi:hypothetical protein